MSGYTVTLTDAEYDALKERIAKLEAMHQQAIAYSTKLQQLIEQFRRGVDPLPYPDLYHSRMLTAYRAQSETKGDANGDL